ncbi:MAG: hypothetical protein JNK72_09645 [Myxococcales bacterium]|nr:hypothetical protein [Myxococcales bacterium]
MNNVSEFEPLGRRRGRLGVVLSVCLSACAWASAAGAQPRATPVDARGAREHYEQGTQLYSNGRFAEAAAEFLLAYNASQRVELLFNLGRAYEDAAMYTEALDAYERFDRAGAPGVERAQLQGRISIVRARLAAQRPAPNTVVNTGNVNTVNIVPNRTQGPGPTPGPTPRPSRARPTLSYVLLGAGGALVLTAVPFWLLANGRLSDLEPYCVDTVCSPNAAVGPRTESELTSLRDEGKTYALVGDIFLGVGLATAAAGVITLVVRGSARSPANVHPSASLVRGGATLGVGFNF